MTTEAPKDPALRYPRGSETYQAYRTAVGGRSPVTGDELPTWESLRPEVRAGWVAAERLAVSMGAAGAAVLEVRRIRPRAGDLVAVAPREGDRIEPEVLRAMASSLGQALQGSGVRGVALEGGLQLHHLRLVKGNVLVLGVGRELTQHRRAELQAQLKDLLPENPALVVEYGRTIKAMTRAQVLELRDQLDEVLNT